MTQAILFDSSTMISMAMTCSLPVLEKLHSDYGGDFLISESVKRETIDKAAQSKRFKYEGYRLQRLIDEGVFKYYDESEYQQEIDELANLANSAFTANGRPIKIVHLGEVSMLVVAKTIDADGIAIDERATRLLIENPHDLPKLMGHKLHTFVKTDQNNLNKVKSLVSGLRVMRSVDLILAAYKKGYLGKQTKDLLDGILWALKLAGCAVSGAEIDQYLRF